MGRQPLPHCISAAHMQQGGIMSKKNKKRTTETVSAETINSKETEKNAKETVQSAKSGEFFTSYMKKAEEILTPFGLPNMFLMRFIAVFMLISAVQLCRLNKVFQPVSNWKEYVGASSLPMLLLSMLLCFICMTFLYKLLPKKMKILDPLLLIGSTVFFGIAMMWKNNDFYVCLGMMAICIVFTVYAMGRLKNETLEKVPVWAAAAVVGAAALGICIFVSVTSVAHHRIFGTSTFDFGIFVQMFHSMADNLTAITTCERDQFLSHFNIHSSFIFYFLAPFYALFPNENTLLIAQAILAMGGVIPFVLILKNHNFKGGVQIAGAFLYVFCAGILTPCYYDFHENAFLPTILMWLLYAADTKKIWLFYVMSTLTCMVKEDAPLYVMCIALFFLFEEKSYKRLHYLVVLLLSLAYFSFITNWLTKNGDGSMMAASRFGNLTINPDDGFAGIVKNVLTDPAYFFSLFFSKDDKKNSLEFFLQILVPLAFLPFMTKHIHRFLLMIPFIIMNLVVGQNYQYACKIGYQYIFGTACLLIYMAIINAADMEPDRRNLYIFAAAAASVVMLTSSISGKISYYTRYTSQKEHFQQMEECLDSIPGDASVAANTWYVPHIADRNEVYIVDGADLTADPANEENKILIDPYRCEFYALSPNDENTPYIVQSLESAGFTLYNELAGSILIYASPAYTG